ncbi:type II toxin-antitoxin system VapC family toxin [Candidatus Poribacteria bacterium]|nr:type II toxin-antitoxin system VapC family toxin [Candidatus Poribacteria bacterium]
MVWCIDANVLVKAVIREPLSEKAIALMSDALTMEIGLIAPHFFDAETNGAIRKKVYSGEIAVKLGDIAFEKLKQFPVQSLSTSHLLDRSWEIAKQFGLRWLYDAFYIALAEEKSCTLWTADVELYNAVKDKIIFVKSLENYAGMV